MNRNQHRTKWWQRLLLLLLVCLTGGINTVRGEVHFNAKEDGENVGMRITHQPSMKEPYIVVDVLYFDARGCDSFFDGRNSASDSAAVYVDNKWICRPKELTWEGHQNSANDYRDIEGWTDGIYENDYCIIRFFDPHHEANSGKKEDRYRLYMYIWLKGWEVGKTHTVKVSGRWKINDDSKTYYESQTVTTTAFDNPAWSSPTNKMTNYNTVSVSGDLSKSYGDTYVGLYTKGTSAPSSYSSDLAVNEKYTKGKTSFSNLTQELDNFDLQNGRTLPVQYSIPLKFTKDKYADKKMDVFEVEMYAYKWFNMKVRGFTYPTQVDYTLKDPWKKKIALTWNSAEDGDLNTAGKWTVKNATTDAVIKSGISYKSSNTYECTLDEYETPYDLKVYFVPTGLEDLPEELCASVSAEISPVWNFSDFTAEEIEDGISLKWKHNALEDASGKNPYILQLLRSTHPESSDWTSVKDFTITSKNTVSGSFIDPSSDLEPNKTYYYKLSVSVFGMDQCSEQVFARLGGSKILDFTASQGTYSNTVKLQWTVKQVGSTETNFTLQRHPLGGGEDDWATIYSTAGKASSYSYDDQTAQPGSYNEYKVILWSMDGTSRVEEDSRKTDGFSLALGNISGNITYGTGTAVTGAKVVLKQQNADGALTSGMRSVHLSGYGSGFSFHCGQDTLQNLFGKNFSVQMYVRPDAKEMDADDERYQLMSVWGTFGLYLHYNRADSIYRVGVTYESTDYDSQLTISPDKWTQINCVHNADAHQTIIYLMDGGEVRSDIVLKDNDVSKITLPELKSEEKCLAIGNNCYFNSTAYFNGYLDEFRFWTKALTADEISQNYNHPLAGNESGLSIYYPFDEGLKSQTKAYDFSKPNGIPHGYHANADVPAEGSPMVPSEEQLSLMAYTDVNGGYIIRGVPFTGEGTSYSVIPTLGIHEFSPSSRQRFVSMSSLTQSGVDFEDVSSFPVSGKIFYSGTDYPVEGVSLYVDGAICAKDGQIIQTNDQGEYTISVPIGEHSITAGLNGHEFEDGGRYPADPNGVGVKYNFDREIKNLDFYDSTLLNFTGRVVGGDIEGRKSLGFGLSENNIGVAELVLTPLNETPRMNVVKNVTGTTYSYETNPDTVSVASASGAIVSRSWRGGGADGCRKIFIHTDPATGEFSAMLPPLQYKLDEIKVVKTGDVVGPSTTIDLTNVLLERSDSLRQDDSIDEVYTYNTKLMQTYHSDPAVFSVTQDGNDDGAFGISSYTLKDVEGTIKVDDIYSLENGKPVYKYGGAVFEQNEEYTFNIEAYEEYVNYDDDKLPVYSHVPLQDLVVTIDNALASNQAVAYEETTIDGESYVPGQVVQLKSNQLRLDSLGCATYTWMAGFPNITTPYTRTLAISYDIDGRTCVWHDGGLTGIVLGDLPTGNNFVTAGPDMLDMILRDPPGSKSSASWTSGTTTSHTHADMGAWDGEGHLQSTVKFGTKSVTGFGMGVVEVTSLENVWDQVFGIKGTITGEAGDTWSKTIEVTKAISTSDEIEFVGAPGDVFIGSATNVIYGAANNVGFHRVGSSNEVQLGVVASTTTGMEFSTMFNYTQNHIENMLIPNLEAIRNSMLQTASQETIDSYVNTGKHPVYLTTRSLGDPDFGAENTSLKDEAGNIIPSSVGESYTMFVPQNTDECFQDSVMWCNSQINIWKSYLAQNEREKVAAYENREDPDSVSYENYSFDSGSKVTNTKTKTKSDGYKYNVRAIGSIVLNSTFGFAIQGIGSEVDFGITVGAGYQGEDETNDTESATFSYTLSEEGDDNAISVDVYDYGEFAPIFRTRGGQTSAPYEGEVVTKYFEPGDHTIMEATMQIEVPQIEVDKPTVTDIPSGSTATFTLSLSNASETKELLYYRLGLAEDTNPNGAMLFIDGAPLTDVRTVLIEPHETVTKTLLLKQSNLSILDYEDIGIVFASSSQYYPTYTWDVIADTAFVSAHFVPSSSPVTLALSTSLMNTDTGTDLVLTMKDFDRNYQGLKAFRMEYKKQGATSWTQIKEYVLDEANKTNNNELLPSSGASVSYTLDMSSFSDGDYLFRVVSASTYGKEEVTMSSEEKALIKDLQPPTPIGIPEPSDGILDIGDELSVTFNEPILKGELTNEANFKVTGVLNGAEIDHATALSMTATETAAVTDAEIMLAKKDFAFDMWVNLDGGAGTLLTHGNGTSKLTVGLDADNKLVVTKAGTTFTSTNSVPTGKWAFLSLSLTADGHLNASVADDAATTTLFLDQVIGQYDGEGPLSVGKNLRGAIHELLLWDEAHDMTTALLDRSKTKNPSTRHLIGYWKMNEGEGTTIRDYARNRHMTMPDETWYLNNENKAVALDGASYLSIDASELPICVGDDYALEFWMRGDAQTGEAQLVQMGDVALSLSAEGSLQLTGKQAYDSNATQTLTATATKLTDNAWHHVALNVLRLGAAAVYVDGKRCLSTNAANVGSVATNNLIIGARRISLFDELGRADGYTFDRPFSGQIDEVRVWNATMNGDQLTKNRKVRLTGSEDGLVAYYPFEKKTLDKGNQVVTLGDAADLCGSGHEAQLSTLNAEPSTLSFTDEAPALRTKPTETNVSFTFVASNEKVVITLDEDAATIEGCTLNFTVLEVRDENGNYSAPAVWSAFVNQKELQWQEDAIGCITNETVGATLTATIVNKSGTQQMWTLSGMPSWLTVSDDYGTTNPLDKSTVTFTVEPSTPIGKYEETVYVKGNNGIETPLTISVTVKGETPDWSVDPNAYELSMNVIASVDILGEPMSDKDDIVAAFIGEECRGVAHPVYMERFDSYFVTIDVYGHPSEDNKLQEVTFRAFDASTGTLYPVLTPDHPITFTSLALEGRYENPVVLTALDMIEQSTDLKKGWNWLSFYVKTDDMTVPALLNSIKDDGLVIKSQTAFKVYEEVDGNLDWDGNLLDSLTNDQMYAVKVNKDCNLRLVGKPVSASDCQIHLNTGWNWLGYYGRKVSSIADALADMAPEDGDILKGLSGVAYFDEYEWTGSLAMMEPGVGYMIHAGKEHTFGYTSATTGARRILGRNAQPSALSPQPSAFFAPVDYHNYSGNAIMAAKIVMAGQPVVNAAVGVFADDECRATAVTDDRGIAFITIPGDEAAVLTFQVALGDDIITAGTTLDFKTDAIYGSPKRPCLIDLGNADGIDGVKDGEAAGAVYDLGGRKIIDRESAHRKLQRGVYIVNGHKQVVK